MLNAKEGCFFWGGDTNVSFIVYFCLGKYSFSLNTFSTHLIYRTEKIKALLAQSTGDVEYTDCTFKEM